MIHTLYTAGYARWTPAQLQEQVVRLGALLLDIRYSPRSKRAEWAGPALASLLGAAYRHEGTLGNRNYQSGAVADIELAAPERAVAGVAAALERRPVILLCACYDAAQCHRSVAAEYLRDRLGCEVVHLDAPQKVQAGAQAWAAVPQAMRSTVRSFINSNRDEDTERAMAECDRYGLDYQAMRTLILAEMAEEWDRIVAKRAKAGGMFRETKR